MVLALEVPWPSHEVQVYNAAGQLVLHGANLRQIPTIGWPAGLYVLSAQAADGTVLRQKFSVGGR